MASGYWQITRLSKDGPQASPWYRNTITTNLYALAMALLNREPGYTGWQYLALGAGSDSWDGLANPPPAPASATSISGEFARFALTNAHYLDGAGNLVSTVNRYAMLEAYIGDDGAGNALGVGSFRELAWVGGTASGVLGSGLYLAVLRIPKQMRFSGDDPLIIKTAIAI